MDPSLSKFPSSANQPVGVSDLLRLARSAHRVQLGPPQDHRDDSFFVSIDPEAPLENYLRVVHVCSHGEGPSRTVFVKHWFLGPKSADVKSNPLRSASESKHRCCALPGPTR